MLRAVASYGLGQFDAGVLPGAPLADEEFASLVAAAFHEKLSGLLLDVIEDGVFAASDAQADLSAAQAAAWFERTRVVDRALRSVDEILTAAAIDRRFVKGAATALRLYGDALRRPYVDVDVVVPTASFAAAMRALDQAGWHRRAPDHRPGFAERFAQAVAVTDGTSEVDVHRMLVHPPAGDRLPADVAFDLPAASVAVDDHPVPVLQPADALVHSAAHFLFDHLHPTRALAASDLLRWRAKVEPTATEARAYAWGLSGLVPHALSLAHRELFPHDPVRAQALVEADEKLLALRNGDVRLGRIRTIDGAFDKARYAVAMLLPSQAYLEANGQARTGRLRMVTRTLRRRR